MMNRILVLGCSGILLLNLYGCVALLAGAAGGAGTAVWLSGKLSQQLNATYEETIAATREAADAMSLEVTKETQQADMTQIKGRYNDDKEFWIDIRRVSDVLTKVDVRVGGVSTDKEAASSILRSIESHL